MNYSFNPGYSVFYVLILKEYLNDFYVDLQDKSIASKESPVNEDQKRISKQN